MKLCANPRKYVDEQRLRDLNFWQSGEVTDDDTVLLLQGFSLTQIEPQFFQVTVVNENGKSILQQRVKVIPQFQTAIDFGELNLLKTEKSALLPIAATGGEFKSSFGRLENKDGKLQITGELRPGTLWVYKYRNEDDLVDAYKMQVGLLN